MVCTIEYLELHFRVQSALSVRVAHEFPLFHLHGDSSDPTQLLPAIDPAGGFLGPSEEPENVFPGEYLKKLIGI